MEDRRMKKILKQDSKDNSSLLSQGDCLDSSNESEIFQTCLSTKTVAENLTKQVEGLVARIQSLENEVTLLKLQLVQQSTDSHPVTPDVALPAADRKARDPEPSTHEMQAREEDSTTERNNIVPTPSNVTTAGPSS